MVVDASVAVKWVLLENLSDEAFALKGRWTASHEWAIAPPIFRPEITNALHRAVQRGEIDKASGSDGVGLLVASTEIDEPLGLYSRAFEIAGELSLGATYDALYIALAEHHTCDMWTADRRLVRATQRRFPAVRWLGDVPIA